MLDRIGACVASSSWAKIGLTPVATAHKLLRVLYVVLRDARPYQDPEADYEELMVRRNAPRWIRMLHRYGLIERERASTATA